MNPSSTTPVSLSPEEHQQAVLAALPQPEALEVGLFDAVGLVLADHVHAAQPVPANAVAAATGVAVKAADTASTSVASPGVFTVVNADELPGHDANPAAVRILDGELLPYGYDTVMPLAAASRTQTQLVVTGPVTAGTAVVTAGSDVAAQQLLAAPGHLVTAGDVALFAAAGLNRVTCVPSPRIVVVGVRPGDALAPADPTAGSTRPVAMMVAALVKALGAMVFLGDESFASREALAHALDANLGRADMIILVGGNSFLTAPRVAAVLATLGASATAKVNVAGLETQIYGAIGACPVIAVSELPGAAHREFELFIRPAVRQFQGRRDRARPRIAAQLVGAIPASRFYDQYVAVRVNRAGDVWQCEPFSDGGLVSPATVALTDGYVHVPAASEGLRHGATVHVMLTGE